MVKTNYINIEPLKQYLVIFVSVCESVCLCAFPSVYHSVCLSIFLSVSHSVSQSISPGHKAILYQVVAIVETV